MIIPKPYNGESRGAFLIRCTSTLVGEGTDERESSTICKSQFDKVEFSPTVFLGEIALLNAIYKGLISPKMLPANLYEFHYKNIYSAVGKGFGFAEDFKKGSQRYKTALAFMQNVSFFSGAKTFQQTSLLSQLVFNDNGTKRPFSEFKALTRLINDEYNKDYLRTEQNTAYSSAQSAEEWQETQDYKKDLPYLRYVTVGDERVRYEHRLWDGITRPVDDDFWNTHYPPNGWNCRCIVVQLAEGEKTNLKKHLEEYNKRVPEKEKVKSMNNPSKVFANNAGKSGFIYNNQHSYFKFPNEYKKSALKNFGFTIPKDGEVKEVLKTVIK